MPDLREWSDRPSAGPVSVGDISGPAVIYLHGELDRASATGLRLRLSAVTGESRVLLDLTDVVFVDKIGVGVLLGAIRGIHEGGGVVAIAGADSRRGIAGALLAAGVERLAFLADSTEGAMQWLSETRDFSP
jgi:anti-anti-sigma factor